MREISSSDTIAVMELFVLLVAAAGLLALATRRATILPYSVALTILGLVVAALALPVQVTVQPDILLAVLVPGLVFEAAYRLHVRDLVPNIASVTMLATVGVLITAVTVAIILSTVTGLAFPLAFLVGTMLVFGSYGRRRASARAGDAIDTVWEFVGFLLTTVVFLLIGLAITIPQLASAIVPALAAMVGLFISRAVVVYLILGPGSRAISRFGWADALPRSWLHLIAWAGLRGAIAVALALSLPSDLPQRDLLQGTVFGAVLLTLLIQGTTIEPLASRLGLTQRDG